MKNLPMTKWAVEDLPSTKMERGAETLTNAELLSLIIGCGSKECDAVSLSRTILEKAGDSLLNLSRLSVKELSQIKGISSGKAMKIVCAMELARRKEHEYVIRKTISTSKDAAEIFMSKIRDLDHEEIWCIFLSTRKNMLCCKRISVGGRSKCLVDPAMILKEALLLNASSFIVSHNHPSTGISPSKLDIELTESLKQAGKAINIPLSDHIIIGGNDYYSFAEEGMML